MGFKDPHCTRNTVITKFARVNLQMYQGHLALFKTICNDFVTLKDVVINIDDDSSLLDGGSTAWTVKNGTKSFSLQ